MDDIVMGTREYAEYISAKDLFDSVMESEEYDYGCDITQVARRKARILYKEEA